MSTAEAIKARTNRMIELEIQRCKKNMGEREWEKHKDWVTANVVAAAKIWLKRQAAEGKL
jgi:hypothetical protein